MTISPRYPDPARHAGPTEPMRKVHSMATIVAAVLALATAHPAAADSTVAPTPASVSVDFGARQGKLTRPERFNNFGNVTAWPEQRGNDVAFFNEQGLHGTIQRVWLSSPNAPPEDNVFNQCDLQTRTCDFSRLDAYLSDASNLAHSVLINLNPHAWITGERPFEELELLVELILSELKDAYPRIRYVEVFNEPDWNYHGLFRRIGQPQNIVLNPGELYAFYPPFYAAANKVNKRLPWRDRLRVGGPALMYLDPRWMEPFLDNFAADMNPRKRLDFISYHAYLSWDPDYRIANLYKGDLSVVSSERAMIEGWLQERGIRRVRSFVTETGIYPGPAFDDSTNPKNDYLRQATGLATYGYLYANQPGTRMFNWCVRHRVEERKDQMVTRTPDGPLLDTFTPYGNMLLMQSMMKDVKVSALSNGPIVDGDNGIYAVASKDHSGASVMLWNWQHVHDESYRVTIDVSRLPAHLRHGRVRQRMYRIDATTSNHGANPDTANLQLVDEQVVTPGVAHNMVVDLGPNAIYLILLEPAS